LLVIFQTSKKGVTFSFLFSCWNTVWI